MGANKGPGLEELVRAYFARQGFFALRGVALRFEDELVTDIDVWLYGRQAASLRSRVIVDVKNRRSPKAFERILWTRGMQLALGCDRAIVATTDASQKVIKFANEQKVALLTKSFLDRLEKGIDTSNRLSAEELEAAIKQYAEHKQDGDWLRKIADAKSGLISLPGYQAFNQAIANFRFFAQRAETRPTHREQALRASYLCASAACIALDIALERVLYDDLQVRYEAIQLGVTYGDGGEGRTQNNIKTLLDVVSKGMENGRVIAKQAGDALDRLFSDVRSEIIAEFFAREHNASKLVTVARELEERAHWKISKEVSALSTDAKAIIGVFADFAQVRRVVLMGNGAPDPKATAKLTGNEAGEKPESGRDSKTSPESKRLL